METKEPPVKEGQELEVTIDTIGGKGDRTWTKFFEDIVADHNKKN